MANSAERSLKELEEEITCSICHKHYKEPKVHSCCHNYCKECIYRLTQRAGNPFFCPECRQDVTLPQGGVDHLQTAFFINCMKEDYSKLVRAHGKVDARCELCSGEAFCRQCTGFIKTVSLDKLKEGGIKEIIQEESAPKTCETHKEPLKMYCFSCSFLICRDCTLIDHAEHKYDFIITSAPGIKKMLVQHLDPLKEIKGNLSRAIKEIGVAKSKIESQGDVFANKIETTFKEYQEIIEKHKQDLLKEAATKVTHKLENLSGQEKSLSTECAVIQSVI